MTNDRSRCQSPYIGVHRNHGSWQARIRIGRSLKHLGNFAMPEDAARAYDAAVRKRDGEFARLNFPERKSGFGPMKTFLYGLAVYHYWEPEEEPQS